MTLFHATRPWEFVAIFAKEQKYVSVRLSPENQRCILSSDVRHLRRHVPILIVLAVFLVRQV